jgi:hypothetical protein
MCGLSFSPLSARHSDLSNSQGAPGAAQEKEWFGVSRLALAKLVSRAGADWRSTTSTSCPSFAR